RAVEASACSSTSRVLYDAIRTEVSARDFDTHQASARAVDGDVLLDEAGEENQLVLLVGYVDAAVHIDLFAWRQVLAKAPTVRVGRTRNFGATRPVQADAPEPS